MAKPEFDSRCLMPEFMILPTMEPKGSWVYASFLTLRTTLEDVQNQPGLRASHLPAPSAQHRLGSQERQWAGGLVTQLKAVSEFSLGEWPGLLGRKGSWGVALEQPWQLGGRGGRVVDADEDGQGQGRYEPDSWILCKGRAGRVTFRLALPGDLQGPVWRDTYSHTWVQLGGAARGMMERKGQSLAKSPWRAPSHQHFHVGGSREE